MCNLYDVYYLLWCIKALVTPGKMLGDAIWDRDPRVGKGGPKVLVTRETIVN